MFQVFTTFGSLLRPLLFALAALAAVLGPPGGTLSAPAGQSFWRSFVSGHPATPLFYQASGVAVGGSGNVFIADVGDHRVEKLTPAGKLLQVWGTDGPGPLHFGGPYGIAVDSWGYVYLIDGGLVKLSSSGRVLAHWTGGALKEAAGIAVDRQRRVDLVSLHHVPYSNLADVMTVTQLSPVGKTLFSRVFSFQQPAQGVLSAAIAAAPNGGIVLSLAAQRYCHSCDGADYQVWQLDARGTPAVASAPIGGMSVAVDAAGSIYLAGPGEAGAFSPAAGTMAAFGSAGCGAAQFGSVLRLAAGPGGKLYVADNQPVETGAPFRAGVLHELGNGGAPLGLYGTCPTIRDRLFGQIRTLARTPNGTFFVEDVGSGAVRTVAPDGTVGGAIAQGYPSFVTADRAGNLYLGDLQASVLQKMSPAGQVLAEVKDVEFENIAFSRSGAIYGLNVYGQVQELPAITGFGGPHILRQWRLSGYGPSWGGPNPTGIALDRHDTVYIADTRLDRVQVFTPTGRLLRIWGGKQGSAPGQFKRPSKIVADGRGHIYVVDTGNNRVQEFDTNGRLLRVLGREGQGLGQFIGPVDVVTDGHGNLYVADNGNDRIVELVNP